MGGLGQALGGWCCVMSVCVVSLDYLCRLQVQVSVYCAPRLPAHLRCTQCSNLLQLIDICILMCIYLSQISQISICLHVVIGPGLASTSAAFMRSSASHSASQHGRIAQNAKASRTGPDAAEYKSNLDLKINNTALRMATHSKVLGLTLDPKLTYSTHIHNISVQAHTPLQMIKTLFRLFRLWHIAT